MNTAILEFKNKLKSIATTIRELKDSRKEDKRTRPLWEIEVKILKLKFEFRHNHIAYCELRGTPYDKIESPSIYNPPNGSLIEKIKIEWKKKIENANVCCLQKRFDPEPTGSSVGSCNC